MRNLILVLTLTFLFGLPSAHAELDCSEVLDSLRDCELPVLSCDQQKCCALYDNLTQRNCPEHCACISIVHGEDAGVCTTVKRQVCLSLFGPGEGEIFDPPAVEPPAQNNNSGIVVAP